MSPPIPITRSGEIGTLTLDRSTAADVVRAWGAPTQQTTGNVGGGPGFPNYTLLGYQCRGARSPQECAIDFYINQRTGRLESFTTTSPRFWLFGGVHVGMSGTLASQREHSPELIGCGSDIDLRTATMNIGVGLIGARMVGNGPRGVGGHVQNISIDDRAHGVDVLFC